MISVLAQAADSVLVGTGSGIATLILGTQIKHITNTNRHINGRKYQSKEVCEERHKNIDEKLDKMDKKLDKLLGDD